LGASNATAGAILAPHAAANPSLAARIAVLREAGEIVVELLPGETGCEGPLCDRHLVEESGQNGGQWIIQALDGK